MCGIKPCRKCDAKRKAQVGRRKKRKKSRIGMKRKFKSSTIMTGLATAVGFVASKQLNRLTGSIPMLNTPLAGGISKAVAGVLLQTMTKNKNLQNVGTGMIVGGAVDVYTSFAGSNDPAMAGVSFLENSNQRRDFSDALSGDDNVIVS